MTADWMDPMPMSLKYLTVRELKDCKDPVALRAQSNLRLELNTHLVGTLYPAINYAEAGALNARAFYLENPDLMPKCLQPSPYSQPSERSLGRGFSVSPPVRARLLGR